MCGGLGGINWGPLSCVRVLDLLCVGEETSVEGVYRISGSDPRLWSERLQIILNAFRASGRHLIGAPVTIFPTGWPRNCINVGYLGSGPATTSAASGI